MDYIQKIPLFLGIIMTIIVGMISYVNNVGQQQTYIRMAICLIAFFAIGIWIRNTLENTIDNLEKRKAEEEGIRLKEIQLEKKTQEQLLQDGEINNQTSSFDFKIEDSADQYSTFGEDFSPLTVREVIRKELNK